ncbi:MAG: DNA-processing protein DprA [Bdellovibrionales bacterium]|nr:DNA-processing protein DprA [Bdellovibrionales bacterium]
MTASFFSDPPSPAALSAAERTARLRLIRSENVGPITYNRLMQRFGTAERALKALPELARRGGGKKEISIFAQSAAEDEIARIEKFGAKLIVSGDAEYPALLGEAEDAPPVLTVLGNPALLSRPALGVVGARNASLAGRKIAEGFSAKVGAAGYTIVSGLARGIDSAAHAASLQSGTVAVVAGGIDVIYPRENEALYRAIAAQGAIVAESPFGTEPLARHFPRRNRIISGLSLGVLIVEAAHKSGSLITARMAIEQNREVFAVPGSPLDPRAGGTNSLLKDGAHVTTSAEDILQVLGSLRVKPLREPPQRGYDGGDDTDDSPLHAEIPDSLRIKILENLSPAPVSIDDLIREVNAPVGYILTILLELELAGRIERQAGNKVNLI